MQHILETARSDGFRNFVISLHYLGHMVEEHFGDGSDYGVRIEYLREDAPLGTAGCLSLLPKIPELPFIVTNGDVLTDIHYNEFLDFHNRHDASATMAVRQHEMVRWPLQMCHRPLMNTRRVDAEFAQRPETGNG